MRACVRACVRGVCVCVCVCGCVCVCAESDRNATYYLESELYLFVLIDMCVVYFLICFVV